MDPQQRVMLEGGYASLHASSFDKATLNGSGTGVALGIYATEFATLLAGSPLGCSVYASTNALSIASGRVSFALGLQGPCASFETACSASLVACHSAARALQHAECSTHLAAGVNLMLLPASSVGMAIAGMTSVAGRCHTFDSRADGFCRGEGCSVVVVRDESAAWHESAAWLLVLRGSAVRQDGRSASLTAPNGQAQQNLLRGALQDASLEARAISLNEAHGTGTALGAPIEAGSLVAAVLAEQRPVDALVCGGIKANLGHGESTAGMSGLLQMALGVVNGEASPNAQLRVLNPHVRGRMRGVPTVMPCQLANGAAASNTRALQSGGVSSFGYSGTIARVVLVVASGNGCKEAATGRVRNRPWAPAFSSRNAEPAFGPFGARCSQNDVTSPAFAAHPSPQLAFCRLAAPWRNPTNPLAQRCLLSSDSTIRLRSPASGPLHLLVSDHVVQGRVIFPGAGYLEMVRAAADSTALRGVYFVQPLAVEAPGLLVECAVSDGLFEVRSSGVVETAIVHCSGAAVNSSDVQRVDLASRRALPRVADLGALYDGFHTVGLQYGPGYRTLGQAWGDGSDAVARLRTRSTHEGTQVHPADLDDALCASFVAASSSGDGKTRLPFAVDDALLRDASGEQWAVSRCRHEHGDARMYA